MIEVEAKYRVGCERFASIASTLESMGFENRGDSLEVDEYYQHPCRDFAATDEALRVRRRGDGAVELTYKGPRESSLNYKGRLELTARVADSEQLSKVLEALGFKKAVVVVKQRRVYEKSGVSVALDEVRGLGCFVEIEGGLESIESVAEKLGLKREDYVAETYAELLLALGDTYRSHSSH
ncbi:MAG: class IV adenylate cyclase [Acidilobaceae archaeon]